jgi:hypothetical protein
VNDAENAGRRFLALAALQTLLVGLLAGVLVRINPYPSGYFLSSNVVPGGSDLAAVLAAETVEAVVALVVLLNVVVPLFVLANADPVDRRRAALAGGAALLGLSLAGFLVVSASVLPLGSTTPISLLVFGLSSVITSGGFAVLAAVVGGLAASALGARSGESFHVAAAPLGICFSLLLVAGLFVGAPVSAAVGDVAFVVGGQNQAIEGAWQSHSPDGTFAYRYEPIGDGPAVLAIRHRGGPSIPADELYIEGDSVVAVDGANQTEAGRWQGSTVPGANGPTVDTGSAVAVGVTEGCVVRVVRRDESDAATIGTYDCLG